MTLNPGDVIRVGLGGGAPWDWAPATFRVIEVLDPKDSYQLPGTVWIAAYEIGENGKAIARREIYTRKAGIRLLQEAPPAAPAVRRPVNGRPAMPRIPAPRRPAGTTTPTATGRTR